MLILIQTNIHYSHNSQTGSKQDIKIRISGVKFHTDWLVRVTGYDTHLLLNITCPTYVNINIFLQVGITVVIKTTYHYYREDKYARPHAHKHAYSHASMQTHTHLRTHTHIHPHTQIHAHTLAFHHSNTYQTQFNLSLIYFVTYKYYFTNYYWPTILFNFARFFWSGFNKSTD